MIRPIFHHVIIKYENVYDTDPIFIKAKKAGLTFAEDTEDGQRRNIGVDKGTVIAMGPTAFEDCPGMVKVGDRVGFQKHSGKYVMDEVSQEKFILINDEDVQYVQE